MPIPYAFVSLLDVLGYRAKIEADRLAGAESFKTKLEAALGVLSGINQTEMDYQAISDTLIISAHPQTSFCELLRTLRRVHLAFLQNELFLRGGVAFAPHFRSGSLTYSHALPVAYQLEQQQAVYPRIAIDPNIIQMFDLNGKLAGEAAEVAENKLICLEGGVYFVNVASDNTEAYYDLAKRIYEQESTELHGREHELAKHRWLQNYLIACSGNALQPYIDGLRVFDPVAAPPS